MIWSRCCAVLTSGSTIKPPSGVCAKAVTVALMAAASAAGAAIVATANVCPAASIGCSNASAKGAVCGLNKTAARPTAGATSLSVCSHLPLIENSKFVKPVTLPPGRARLGTKPLPAGSVTCTNTVGNVVVSLRSSASTGVYWLGSRRAKCSLAWLPPGAGGRHPRLPSDSRLDVAAVHPAQVAQSVLKGRDPEECFRIIWGERHQYAERAAAGH